MIFNDLSPSSNKSMESLKSVCHLLDIFLKYALLDPMHRVAALIALLFKSGSL